jgi:hypothetical protein
LFPFLGTHYFVTVIETHAMATTKNANENFNMDDFESLLTALSAEELENINELVDPEVFYLFHMFFFYFYSLFFFLLRILIYQQVTGVKRKQIKLQRAHMIDQNF